MESIQVQVILYKMDPIVDLLMDLHVMLIMALIAIKARVTVVHLLIT